MLQKRNGFVFPCAILVAVLGDPIAAASDGDKANDRLRCSTIAFSSTCDAPTGNPLLSSEIYLIDGDVLTLGAGKNPRRLTENGDADGFPVLSPDGKGRIVFDSNRAREGTDPANTSFLFFMRADGTHQTFLVKGGSPTWSPNGKYIAFHASASGLGLPINPTPGAATEDSDIFIARLSGRKLKKVTNLMNAPGYVDDDPDWSPDGKWIVHTSHDASERPSPPSFNYTSAEIYMVRIDGSEPTVRLTTNAEEERAPAWSPDGKRIAYMCRKGAGATPTFEICVINADGTGEARLTTNTVNDATPTWSPDGNKILFHRPVGPGNNELWTMDPDGNNQAQLTDTDGQNLIASWGELNGECEEPESDDDDD